MKKWLKSLLGFLSEVSAIRAHLAEEHRGAQLRVRPRDERETPQ